jgi:predicted RNase H-like nuclease (RuvC/YqgF family)
MTNFLKSAASIVKSMLYAGERRRTDKEFRHIDERIDKLELHAVETTEQIKSLKEVTLANLEVIEQKVNGNSAVVQSIDLIARAQFSYLEKNLGEMKSWVRSGGK